MRYAFISDIHGNLQALEQVLAEIQKASVDQIVCLGDVASLGPQPREVIALLKGMDIPIVKGNHDHYLLNPELTEGHLAWLRDAELWCLNLLTEDDLKFLTTFQPFIRFSPDEKTNLLCYHGSFRSNEEFLYPDTPAANLDKNLGREDAKILIGGHTHVQMLRQHTDMTLINPGSIGMPFEYPMRGPEQHAFRRTEYAILDAADGRFNLELHRLPIDFDQLTRTSLASGMPGVEFWLSTWDL